MDKKQISTFGLMTVGEQKGFSIFDIMTVGKEKGLAVLGIGASPRFPPAVRIAYKWATLLQAFLHIFA